MAVGFEYMNSSETKSLFLATLTLFWHREDKISPSCVLSQNRDLYHISVFYASMNNHVIVSTVDYER